MPHLAVHCSESVTHLAAPGAITDAAFEAAASTGLFASTGAGRIKGRTAEQKAALSARVAGALKRLLPSVEVISTNVTDFERASYRHATMVEADDVAG